MTTTTEVAPGQHWRGKRPGQDQYGNQCARLAADGA